MKIKFLILAIVTCASAMKAMDVNVTTGSKKKYDTEVAQIFFNFLDGLNNRPRRRSRNHHLSITSLVPVTKKFLADKGDPNYQSKNDETHEGLYSLLHLAVMRLIDDPEFYTIMHNAEADFSAKDYTGKTPLDLAKFQLISLTEDLERMHGFHHEKLDLEEMQKKINKAEEIIKLLTQITDKDKKVFSENSSITAGLPTTNSSTTIAALPTTIPSERLESKASTMLPNESVKITI